MEVRNNSGKDSLKEVIVSIVVPTYNRASVIQRAINSIKEQTFDSWECIIVDDHSTDNSYEVINRLVEDDKRFSLIENTRSKGAPGARNTGIIASKGEYVVLFDSDNVMYPDFLKKVYEAIKCNNVEIGGCFSKVVDENTGNRIGAFNWQGYGHIHHAILRGKSYFDNSSTLIKKQKLFDIGLLDENCPSFQEWDTHIRLSEISTYTTIKEELIDYYRGGNDTISKSKGRAVLGQLYILNKFEKEFKKKVPDAYIRHNLYIYTKIKEILTKEETFHFRELFEKDKSQSFLIMIRLLYIVKKIRQNLRKTFGND